MVHESSRRKMQCSVEFGVKYILLYLTVRGRKVLCLLLLLFVFLCVFFGAYLLSFVLV